MGVKSFHTDRQADRRTDGLADATKVGVTFRSRITKAP